MDFLSRKTAVSVGALAIVLGLIGTLVFPRQADADIVETALTTTFTSENGCDGSMFDIIADDDITIINFDQNIYSGGDQPKNVRVYYKTGSYVGFEMNAGAWTLLGSTSVASLGDGIPTPLNIGGLTIMDGESYGIYIDVAAEGHGNNYTNGRNTYFNPQLSIVAGTGLCGTFGSVSVNANRIWNGTVHYTYDDTVVPTLTLLPDSSPSPTEEPTAAPTFEPTDAPSDRPTEVPTEIPTEIATEIPTEPPYQVPNLGLIEITVAQAQSVFESPNGGVVRDARGNEIRLPNDADQSGADTYIVTGTRFIDDTLWLSIYLGSKTWVWVPLADVTVIQPIDGLNNLIAATEEPAGSDSER